MGIVADTAAGRGDMIGSMRLLLDLSRRRCEPETMDDPGLGALEHLAALRGLERINRWSGSVDTVWSAIAPLAASARNEPLRILDIATGAGDVPIGLWRRAMQAECRLEIDACDASPRALEHARERAAQVRAEVRFLALDVLRDPLPTTYDVLTSSLFLHHLTDEQAEALLASMGQACRRLVAVNDLRRSWRGLVLAGLGTRVLSRSHVVRTDAVRSVRAAFSLGEIRALAARAGLSGSVVQARWPQRFLLTWQRDGPAADDKHAARPGLRQSAAADTPS